MVARVLSPMDEQMMDMAWVNLISAYFDKL
jgi:hypothetical protein